MTAFTIISNALVAVGAKPFATTMQAFRDNLLSAFEGDATAVAAGVTLKDPALYTGAATAEGTTWVALRMAGISAGAVGSYSILHNTSTVNATQTPGTTAAGSGLEFASASGASGTNPSGTWRCMGRSQTNVVGTIPLNDTPPCDSLAEDFLMADQSQVQSRNVTTLPDGRFDCEIEHPQFGWIPFTAGPDDVEPHGRAIWQAIKDAQPAG